jgi:hypothetical protein
LASANEKILTKTLLPRAAIVAIATVFACRHEPPPLGRLSGVTRVEVRPNYGRSDSTVVLTDPTRITAIINAVNDEDGSWHDVWDTRPAGDLAAQFFRRDSSLGVLWIGPQFIAERGKGPWRLTSVSSATEAQLRRLFNPHLVALTPAGKPS